MPVSRWLLLFTAAGVLFGAGAGCSKEQKKQVVERETRAFRRQIPVQGTVWPVEYATISAKISGTLELLKVDEGDVRKKVHP